MYKVLLVALALVGLVAVALAIVSILSGGWLPMVVLAPGILAYGWSVYLQRGSMR